MNSKNIKKHLNWKVNDWIKSVDDEEVQEIIRKNVLITGGALTSLLMGETPNDYDVYFRNIESAEKVAKYYANKFNVKKGKEIVTIKPKDNRLKCFIQSSGIAVDDEVENGIDDETEITLKENEDAIAIDDKVIEKYKPRYFTSNAITLSDNIQLVIRFFGEIDKIHENYDFVHCTCSYDHCYKKVELPQKALECILNKELVYQGSKYPLCSIIRTRKFISRGYTINAGQYVKMALQLNELELTNIDVLEEQLTGVDSAYFMQVIDAVKRKKENNEDFDLTTSYLIELINRIF